MAGILHRISLSDDLDFGYLALVKEFIIGFGVDSIDLLFGPLFVIISDILNIFSYM